MRKLFKIFTFILIIFCGLSLTGCSCGMNAYELAVENGFVGSLNDWLDSLKGSNGKDAEIFINAEGYLVINGQVTNYKACKGDVEFRFNDGTLQYKHELESDWVDLVNISNGKEVEFDFIDGKLYWKYVGDKDWIELTNIYNGTNGTSISNVLCDIVYIDGDEYLKFTFVLDNLSTKEVLVPMPKDILNLSLVNNEYNIIEAGDISPTLQLKVQYEDSYEVINVTSDMLRGEIDFTKAGIYNIEVTYSNKTLKTFVKVIDEKDNSIINISATYPYVVMLMDDNALNLDLTGLSIDILLANNDTYSVMLTEDMVDVDSEIHANVPIVANVNYLDNSCTFTILPVNSIDKNKVSSAKYFGLNEFVCEVNNTPFKNEYIKYSIYDTYVFFQKVSTDMFNNLDLTIANTYTCTFNTDKTYYPLQDNIKVYVFDLEEAIITNISIITETAKVVESGIPEMYISIRIDDTLTYIKQITEEMLVDTYDFTITGEQYIEIYYLERSVGKTIVFYE